MTRVILGGFMGDWIRTPEAQPKFLERQTTESFEAWAMSSPEFHAYAEKRFDDQLRSFTKCIEEWETARRVLRSGGF